MMMVMLMLLMMMLIADDDAGCDADAAGATSGPLHTLIIDGDQGGEHHLICDDAIGDIHGRLAMSGGLLLTLHHSKT